MSDPFKNLQAAARRRRGLSKSEARSIEAANATPVTAADIARFVSVTAADFEAVAAFSEAIAAANPWAVDSPAAFSDCLCAALADKDETFRETFHRVSDGTFKHLESARFLAGTSGDGRTVQ